MSSVNRVHLKYAAMVYSLWLRFTIINYRSNWPVKPDVIYSANIGKDM